MNNSENHNSELMATIQQLTPKPVLPDDSLQRSTQMDTILKGDEKFEFSNYKLKEIANRSNQNFLMLHEKNKTLSICCAWKYFSNIFGPLEKKDLQNKYPFLNHKEERFRLDSIEIINKYYFHDSFLKTYFYKPINSETLVCGSITDKEFVLRHNIQIGMDKGIFLGLLFDEKDINTLIKFDTINIGEDESGGREYYYIFNNRELIKIIIDSDVDWVDKELK
jgi:hypothetical protein